MVDLKLGFYNTNNLMIQDSFRLGIISPVIFKSHNSSLLLEDSPYIPSIKLPNDISTHQIGQINSIYPEAWEFIDISLISNSGFEFDTWYQLIVIVYTQFGSIKFPFQINFTYS